MLGPFVLGLDNLNVERVCILVIIYQFHLFPENDKNII